MDVWKFLAKQYREVLDGESWSGPSLDDLLQHDADAAAFRPDPVSRSAHEIALHVLATCRVVSARLRGKELILTPDEDWPECNDAAWQDTVDALKGAVTELADAIELLRCDAGDAILPGYSSVYRNLAGNLEHLYYHFGQMMGLLKQSARRSAEHNS